MGLLSKLFDVLQKQSKKSTYAITTNNKNISSPQFEINDLEKTLLDQLKLQLKAAGIGYNLSYDYLSNGTMSVSVESVGQIGRVKLRGRKYRMQIMKITSIKSYDIDVKWLEDISFDEILSNVPKWVAYVKQEQSYRNKKSRR